MLKDRARMQNAEWLSRRIPHFDSTVFAQPVARLLLKAAPDGARGRKESVRSSASQIRIAVRRDSIAVSVQISVPGRNVAARLRFFRRPQQLTEVIGVLFFADVLPGQVAKRFKGKRRTYRLALNRWKSHADLSAQFWAERVQFHFVAHKIQEIGNRKLRARVDFAEFRNGQRPVTIRVNTGEGRSCRFRRAHEVTYPEQGGPVQVDQFRHLFGAAGAD